jgi:hypothetical protein
MGVKRWEPKEELSGREEFLMKRLGMPHGCISTTGTIKPRPVRRSCRSPAARGGVRRSGRIEERLGTS